MKDSGIEWIGEIPKHWGIIRSKHVATITNGSDPKTPGDTPVYGSGNISFKTCGESKEGPTVLIGRKGATLHIPHYIDGNYWNVDTALDVKTDEQRFFLKYYYYNAICFDYQQYISTTTLPSMTQTNYDNMFLPYPPIGVQKQIVIGLEKKLDVIDELIAAKEKTNALLKERRQSIIYETVTKGLNPDVPMKDSGVEWIGEIPEEWNITALKRIGTPSTGSTPSKANSAYWNGSIPWFSSKDLKSDFLFDSEDHISQEAVDQAGLTVLPEGSIIFCVRSGILRHTFPVAITKIPATINQDLRAMTLNKTVHPEYLLYYLKGINDVIIAQYQKVGATVESIEMEWFNYLPVIIPDMDSQISIAAHLKKACADIEDTIKANTNAIEQLREYRQSVIYEAVTGKIQI